MPSNGDHGRLPAKGGIPTEPDRARGGGVCLFQSWSRPDSAAMHANRATWAKAAAALASLHRRLYTRLSPEVLAAMGNSSAQQYVELSRKEGRASLKSHNTASPCEQIQPRCPTASQSPHSARLAAAESSEANRCPAPRALASNASSKWDRPGEGEGQEPPQMGT